MSEQLQLRGGTNADHTTFTGAAREVTVDTTFNQLRVHDGVTLGGHVVGGALGMTFMGEIAGGAWIAPSSPSNGDAWLATGTITGFPGGSTPVDGDLIVYSSKDGWLNIGSGIQGPPGVEGPVGPEGPIGPEGPKGEQGTGITLAGHVPTVGDLPTYAPAGTVYFCDEDNSAYVSDGDTPSNWANLGPIQGTTQDLQSVLENGDTTEGVQMRLNSYSNGTGNPAITVSALGAEGVASLQGGYLSITKPVGQLFEVGKTGANGTNDWTFQIDAVESTFSKQLNVNAPLIVNRYIELSQGTGSAGGTEININAEDGEVTLYDTSPIGGTPKTVLWRLEKNGGAEFKSQVTCNGLSCTGGGSIECDEHLIIEESATIGSTLTAATYNLESLPTLP